MSIYLSPYFRPHVQVSPALGRWGQQMDSIRSTSSTFFLQSPTFPSVSPVGWVSCKPPHTPRAPPPHQNLQALNRSICAGEVRAGLASRAISFVNTCPRLLCTLLYSREDVSQPHPLLPHPHLRAWHRAGAPFSRDWGPAGGHWGAATPGEFGVLGAGVRLNL